MAYEPTAEDLKNPCKICKVIYNGKDSMVLCNDCNEWHHLKCVGNPTVSKKQIWTCPKCVDAIKSADNDEPLPEGAKMKKLEEKLAKQSNEIKELLELNKRLMQKLKLESKSKKVEPKKAEPTPQEESTVKKQDLKSSKKKIEDNLKSDTDTDSSSDDEDFNFKKQLNRKKLRHSFNDDSSETSDDEDDNPKAKNQLKRYIAQQELRELPSFDGSAIQWPSFIRTYKESKKYFSKAANRNRLEKALKGKALKAVSGLLLSPSTVDDAIDMLEYRFGQSEQIIEEAVDQAMNAEQPNESKPETIVDFAMLVLSIKANISAVGDDSDKMNPMLIKALVERLPSCMQKCWNRRKRDLKNRGKIIKISSFSKWLLTESQDYVDMIPTKARKKKGSIKSHKSSINVHNEQPRGDEKLKDKKLIVCFKCSDKEHSIEDCKEFKQMTIDQRQQFVRTNGICFVCLRKGHRWRRCRRRNSNGGRIIHALVKNNAVEAEDENEKHTDNDAIKSEEKEIEKTFSHYNGDDDKSTIFRIIPVVLYGPVSQYSTYALIDECASSTLIEEEVAHKLKLSGPVVPLLLGWTKDITNLEEKSMTVKLQISAPDVKSEKFLLKNVRTVRHLSLPSQSCSVGSLRSKYPYLKHVEMSNLKSAVPTILIGLDHANLIAPLEFKTDPNEAGPVAVRTKLGWSIHGPENHGNGQVISPTFLVCECKSSEEQRIGDMMEKYFSQEDFGVKVPKLNQSPEDKIALDILEKTTKRVGGCYETGLLWRINNVIMPNNFKMCLRRLISIESKMKINPKFSEAYKAKIQEYLDKKYAKKLSEDELATISSNMWILPHFGVSTKNKPKLRLVFDAKAAYSGVSLNSNLLTGPDQYNSLVGILFRFREGKYAVAADVREMFHMVKIREDDRKFQCFLWRNGESHRRPDVFMMNVMIFGATSSPCSAQYVKNTNALRYLEKFPRAVDGILKRFYVDDYMDSFSKEEEALVVVKKVIEINRDAGFELRNVISNSELVRRQLGNKCDAIVMNLDLEKENLAEKVLGLFWDTNTDQFLFKFQFASDIENESTKVLTKRGILRILMSVFDPIGLLAHYVVRGKIILQDIWMKKLLDWDAPLPEDICERWWEWMNGLESVGKLKVNRNYSQTLLSSKNVQLHVFTDASERAFASVAFVRVEFDDECQISLIAAKTKIPSVKSSKILSIPRLELQGALLGVRLANFIQKEHSITFQSVTFWTDSQTVLSWLNTEYGSFKPFVAHRISEILDTTISEQWKYVASKFNPADDATKPGKQDPFDINGRWFGGPDFLKEPEKNWPRYPKPGKTTIDDPEVRRIFVISNSGDKRLKKCLDYSPVNPENFSNWHEMLRITAWAKRGLYNWSKRLKGEQINQMPLSVHEINESMKYFAKKCQRESYPEEIASLKQHQPVSLKSKIRDLMPFLDEEGVMRMDGRIESSVNAALETKKPIILHRNHQVTILLLDEYHRKYQHQFQEAIVNDVRSKFWIPQVRIGVKRAKARCQECKNRSVSPKFPQMSKLPLARLAAFQGLFYNCGVDLFGPMQVVVKRSLEKRWGVVFTCLTSRAVYIDVVPDLSSDSMIMSIRNCNSRRGPIAHLYSDCGTNLKGAKTLLNEALNEITINNIQRDCVKQNIEWHFNPPAYPHMGGCWERMVRSIKNVLTVMLKEKHPRDNTLRSLLCEVEDIINMRPLTYVALEKDSDEAITPKHFLNPYFRNPGGAIGEFSEADLVSRKQWRQVQMLASHFWKRWVNEYTPMITRTTKWHEKMNPLKVGDIVVICDGSAPRNQWEKAVVVHTNISKDGQVRSVSVKTSHGILTRPTVMLAKLDVINSS